MVKKKEAVRKSVPMCIIICIFHIFYIIYYDHVMIFPTLYMHIENHPGLHFYYVP